VTAVGDRTRALVAPASIRIAPGFRAAVRADLVTRLGPLVAPLAPGDPLVVDSPLLRQARTRPEMLTGPQEPFAWRPVYVRRSLGLAVVDACARGRFPTPLAAAGPVVVDAVDRWEETGWRTFHWEPWVAGLAPGARAVVLAEAVGWASSLWSSLDWSAFDPLPQFGGADDQWVCPAVRTLRLKARPELRVPLVGAAPGAPGGPTGGDRGAVALVSVSGGHPPETWRGELAYLALVASLRSPSRPVPVRVLGLWPDAGADRCVEIDEAALTGAADRVVGTVAAVVEARRSVPAGPA
jgi:hypothetical protein